MKFIKEHTKEIYFIASVLMFIVAFMQKSTIWAILGCANVVFGINYGKKS